MHWDTEVIEHVTQLPSTGTTSALSNLLQSIWRLCICWFYLQVPYVQMRGYQDNRPSNDCQAMSGIILCICPVNESYTVTPSLIGWVHTQNDPCTYPIAALWEWGCMSLASWLISIDDLNHRKFKQIIFNLAGAVKPASITKFRWMEAFDWFLDH